MWLQGAILKNMNALTLHPLVLLALRRGKQHHWTRVESRATLLQEEKAERAEAERLRRKQSKQKAKDRLRTEKEKAAAEREAKQKADLEEAEKVVMASKERDELERCCHPLLDGCLCFPWLDRAL